MSADRAMDGWCAFHMYYHASLDRVLLALVRPVLGALRREGAVERFFFVRYALGGPHIRLRLRPAPGALHAVRARIESAAATFFAAEPSQASLPAEEIRRMSQIILAGDPHESDGAIYPDNHVREAPFRPEVERYGGPALLEPALEYFALSSAQALRFAAAHGAQPRARQLPVIIQVLMQEASSMVRDAGELESLLSFAFEAAGPAMQAICDRGDRLFEERKEIFVRMLHVELDGQPAAAPGLREAAALLSASLDRVEPAMRLQILSSHMHMTANRLGLSNPEEVYASRLMWRAAREIGRDALARALEGRPLQHGDASARLRELAAATLANPSLYGE